MRRLSAQAADASGSDTPIEPIPILLRVLVFSVHIVQSQAFGLSFSYWMDLLPNTKGYWLIVSRFARTRALGLPSLLA